MVGAKTLDTGFQEFVEVDPKGRYGRYNDILGKGASKIVYRAFDEYEGIEVAWNQVKLYDFLQSSEDLERLYCEIHLLKTLEHKNIMKFYTSWVDPFKGNINFITEMFTSGTLRQYREKHRRVSIRAVKHWCRQILTGLLYLHSHDPPIIHRDLKCDNIFINGHQGEVKIGDLGLAAILRKTHAIHCVGTPEFMAPEVYAEEYNELADIYSFGMCVLEMVTLDYPYSECIHPVQIYKKVISGTKPEALYRVKDPEVRQFIEKCLVTASSRLSAEELLQDPFLQIDDPVSSYIEGINSIDHHLQQPSLSLTQVNGSLMPFMLSNDLHDEVELASEQAYDTSDIETHVMDLFHNHEDEHPPKMGITTKGIMEDGSISLRLKIIDKYGIKRNINFQFDTESDTALCVATEMVAELNITDYDVTRIADMIDEEVASLVPGWKPGPGIDEMSTDPSTSFFRNCVSNATSSGSVLDFPHLEYAEMYGQFGEISYQVEESKHYVAEESPILSTSQPNKLDISSQASASKDSEGEGAPSDQLEKDRNVTHMNGNVGSNLRISIEQLSAVSHEQYFELPKERNQNPTTDESGDYENDISPEQEMLNTRNQLDQQEYRHKRSGSSRRAMHPSIELCVNEFVGEDAVSSSLVPKALQMPRGKIESFHLGKHNSYHLPQNDTDSHSEDSIYLADGETTYRCESHPNFQSPWGCNCEVNAGGG